MAAPPGQTAADLLAMMPFASTLGISLIEATPERACGSLSFVQELTTAGAILHGGALMSLADTVGAICAYLNLPEGSSTATVESKTNFFRAARGGTVRAVAHPIHVGRSFIVVQTDLTDDGGRRLSQTTQTQAVLTP
jgi:1,4-dihydroxy-2-naphthoyl-CoA hydrolase